MMNLTVSTLIQLTSALSLAKNYLSVCRKSIISLFGNLPTQFVCMTCLKIEHQRKTRQWS